jgi:hypothetical protein
MKKKILIDYWRTDIKEWDKITDATASLILQQGETLLKETVDTAASISKRADKIITILIPIDTAIGVYIIDHFANKYELIPLSAIFCFSIMTISLYFSYRNFKNYDISVGGEFPKNIMNTIFINDSLKDRLQYINMVMCICENNQARIEVNRKANERRMKNNVRSLNTLFFLILCPGLAYILHLLFLAH